MRPAESESASDSTNTCPRRTTDELREGNPSLWHKYVGKGEDMVRVDSRRLCAAAMIAAATLTGCVAVVGAAAAEPIPVPSADPFYAAPSDLGSRANGAVLQSRAITPYGMNLPVEAWQVQYKSLDAQSNPTTGVATIVAPTAPWTGPGPRPLVSYQLAEDSLGSQCAPSYSIRTGLGAGVNNSNAEAPISALLLQRNWAVVFPDYQGPQSHFLDGLSTAHRVLDGVRAARAFAPDGLAPDSPLAAMGYSGGAFATMWAMEQQAGDAPELEFAGIAAGGIPADLAAAIRTANGTYAAGLGMLALQGLDRADPAAGIGSLLSDRGREAFAADATSCGANFVTKYPFANLDQYTLAPNVSTDPRVLAASEKQQLGKATPVAPIYAWHSPGDDVLPISNTDALIDTYCADGAAVTYDRAFVPTHAAAGLTGLPGAVGYLGERFAGIPAPEGCIIR